MKDAIVVLGIVGLVGGVYMMILAATGEKWKFKK